MDWMKKISTTPVRGNGFIVDSQATNDNKETNAPSLNQLYKFDNNLLFNSNFTESGNGGGLGWSYSGIASVSPVNGMMITPSAKGSIYSPYYKDPIVGASSSPYGFKTDVLTLTVIFKVGSGDPITFKNTLESSSSSFNIYEDDNGDLIKATIDAGGRLKIDISGSNNGGVTNTYFIGAIKLERGTGSAVMREAKDIGIADAIYRSIADKFKVITGTITLPSSSDDSDVFAGVYVNYPAGYTKANTFVLSAKMTNENGDYVFYGTAYDSNCTRPWVVLEDDEINVSYYGKNPQDFGRTVNYSILLAKGL